MTDVLADGHAEVAIDRRPIEVLTQQQSRLDADLPLAEIAVFVTRGERSVEDNGGDGPLVYPREVAQGAQLHVTDPVLAVPFIEVGEALRHLETELEHAGQAVLHRDRGILCPLVRILEPRCPEGYLQLVLCIRSETPHLVKPRPQPEGVQDVLDGAGQ